MVTRFIFAFLLVSGVLISSVTLAAGYADVLIHTSAGKKFKFRVENAVTPEERAKGLMFRKSMPRGNGMLFVYETPQNVNMWMKNTHIPLDMIFIKRDGRIAYIEENTEPMSTRLINSRARIRAVLELNAGVTSSFGIKAGDRVEILN